MPRRLWGSTPDPGFSSEIELSGGDAAGLLDLCGIGKTLPSKGIAAEEAPPPLLQVEPACPSRNEDVMDAWMPLEPGLGLETRMTAEIIGDDEDIASRIIGFNVGERGNIALGIARSRTAGQHLAIAHT